MAPFYMYLILAFSAAGANKTLGLFLNGCVSGLCPGTTDALPSVQTKTSLYPGVLQESQQF